MALPLHPSESARAKICGVSALRSYRFGSYPLLFSPKGRPRFLDPGPCLEAAGGLRDTPAGRRKYGQYLEWLAQDEPRQKAMAFEAMSNGWAHGTRDFKKALLEDEKTMAAEAEIGAAGKREAREMLWTQELQRCLLALRIDRAEAASWSKWADWKVAVAAWMKSKHLASNGWLATQLAMGERSGVSRSVTDALEGRRETALRIYETLDSQLND